MKRVWFFLLISVVGMLVFFVGGYWTGISSQVRTVVKIALPVLLFLTTLACRRFEYLREWYRLALGFLAAACGFLASWFISDPLLRFVGLSTDSIQGLALAKLFDAFPIVTAAFLVARLGGARPSDLYLRRGKVKIWLIIGLSTFVGFAVLFLLQAGGQGIGMERLPAYAPWTLIFVFSNALMEEFHFRGLLLKPCESLLGRHSANLCIALFFTLVHAPVKYTPDIFTLLAVVFVLALAWGYLIQRTESLWGSVLFHAGGDLMIIVGIYQTYGST
ncbi:MAG: CPBP family intramembrane metalloprotease [Candidatus Krumholzibacteriota bacterium]|nr:CPBP family intramembrane metalloprotease [Candidatus Krumholzibacteriota bacterium]